VNTVAEQIPMPPVPRHPGLEPGSIVPQPQRQEPLAPCLPPDGPRLKAGVTRVIGEPFNKLRANGMTFARAALKRTLAALVLIAMPTVATAQTPCLTPADAEAIALVAMPDIIRETGRVCTALPASSLVRRPSSTFLQRYQAAADAAWPAARAAIVRLSDPAVDALLQSDYARPLLTSLFAPQVVGRIQPADCPTIDRLVTLLEPLPARNTAGIIVATLQYLKARKARGKPVAGVPDLPVCAAAKS